jgi:hypothetical protein
VTEILNDKYYVIKTQKLAWHDAKAACEANDDHLASITSSIETFDVNNVLNSAVPDANSQ